VLCPQTFAASRRPSSPLTTFSSLLYGYREWLRPVALSGKKPARPDPCKRSWKEHWRQPWVSETFDRVGYRLPESWSRGQAEVRVVPVIRTAIVSMMLTSVVIITMWLWFDAQADVEPAGPLGGSVQVDRDVESAEEAPGDVRLRRQQAEGAFDARRLSGTPKLDSSGGLGR
jgi:hypothetical protein